MPKLAANLSMMFNEVEFLDRFEAASDAGFSAVEYLFPYEYGKDELAEKLRANDLVQALHNLPAGDWDGGERGIACMADRTGEFQEGVGEDPSSAVFAFPPRIGEVDMDGADGVLPEERFERDPGISPEHPGISQFPFLQSPCCSAAFPVIDLDPDIIGVRVSHRRVDQEQPSTAADIEFEWLVDLGKAGTIEPLTHIREGQEPRLQVLGWRRPHRFANQAHSSFWSRKIGTPIMVPPKTMRSSTNPWKANSALRP